MYCNICGKEIPKTNQNKIRYNDESIIVCGKHYHQFIKYKKFLDSDLRSCFDSNEYEITTEGTWIYTFDRHQNPSGKFLIDTEDLEKVIAHKWRFWRGSYFTGNFNPIQIHRFILDVNDDKVVDHINGRRWDNRKSNLRICTQQDNLLNKAILGNSSSGVCGVWFDKERNKWSAEIKLGGIKCYLGRWQCFEDAVYARWQAEEILFKEFRSTRNDHNIIPIAQESKNKEKILAYITKRLYEKFPM